MLSDYFARRRAYRRAERELEAMSDRELSDLGIFRADIPRVVRGRSPR